MIYDVTEQLLSARVRWEAPIGKLETYFDAPVRNATRGLYIQYFENENRLPVFDKNRNFSRGGEGRLVIHENGASLKPGKFQDGFVRRRKQDADHLHRAREETFGETYRQCLKFALLLDLSELPKVQLKSCEARLKIDVDEFIRLHAALHPCATRHGDWRSLRASLDIKTAMRALRTSLRNATG
jgi:hypothetical protein